MEIVRLESLEPRGWPAPAVTVGNFDGVHRGHQALIQSTVRSAREAGGMAIALTFDPHPAQVLAPERAPSALMTLAQKAEVMRGLDVDGLAVLPFTVALSKESPESFAHLVLEQAVGARTVVVGGGFRFGHRRSGDVPTLETLGGRMGFRVEAVPPVLEGGEPVSSSRVREALARGDVGSARSFLGRRFFIEGEVVRGAGRGRALGIPTANLAPVNETLPATGVYACLGRFDGGTEAPVGAVANLGRRPTFGGGDIVVEVHLLDWTGDAYGRGLRLEFVDRLREERRFPGSDALLEQVRRDLDQARRILEKP
jgi:riboflavin kinase/FMN adenylyltransferase